MAKNKMSGEGASSDVLSSSDHAVPMKIIAHIKTDFPEKFGIPRQSGLVPTLRAKIVFLPQYRNPDAVRGMEGYSHLWLLWQFSRAVRDEWQPTVRPPRLGGNTRMGVFATRSPYRPNPIGLSSVTLIDIDYDSPEAPVLTVGGADLLDGTPIYDIKPYLAFTDSHPDAVCGFADEKKSYALTVTFSDEARAQIADADLPILEELLAEDPRPSYQRDDDRVYFMDYGAYSVRFRVAESVLTVISAERGGHRRDT